MFIYRELGKSVVVEIDLYRLDVIAPCLFDSMDPVGCEVDHTELLHVLYLLRNNLKIVLIEVKDLDLLP